MIDTAQAVLLFVVVILTILLVILGFQVFLILKELRRTVSKANKVLDDAGTITETVSRPISSLSTIAQGVKTGSAIAALLRGKKKSSKKSSTGEEENE